MLLFQNTNMIVLDVETTGTNPRMHSLVSIGALDFDNPDERFYEECNIWDGAHIDPKALEVNGFKETEIKGEKSQDENQLVKNFLAWLEKRGDMVIAGHNVTFDTDFVRNAAERAGTSAHLSYRVVDLHSITFFHIIRRGMNPPIVNFKTDLDSDKVMNYVGIPAEPKPHNGLNGAIWEAEAFMRLMHDTSMFPQFKEHPIPW